jgi:hypothetical protein
VNVVGFDQKVDLREVESGTVVTWKAWERSGYEG